MLIKGRSKRKIFVSIILALCCVFLALSQPASSYALTKSNDYSRPGDIGYALVGAPDILADFAGEIDEVERKYLLSNSDFELTYSYSIPASMVATNLRGTELTVTAQKYAYTANNGENFTWTPSGVFRDGEPLIYDGERWISQLSEGGDTVNVVYESEILIDYQQINAFLNLTRNAGEQAFAKIKAEEARYEAEMERYGADLAAYNEYLVKEGEYQQALKKYNDYVTEYNAWKRAYDEYVAYLAEYDEYLSELKEYNEYDTVLNKYYVDLDLYQQYLSDLAKYESDKETYDEKLASSGAATAIYQLSILKYMNTKVRLDRTLSGALLGDSVTQVLGQTEALVLAGAERAAVNRANDATKELRRLINAYGQAKTDEEKYFFYINSYQQLRDNFVELLRALDYFYGFQAVRGEIARRERTEQYEILLAQLYYICNALYSGKIGNYIQEYKYDKTGAGYFDSSYRIGPSKRTPAALVGEGGTLKDEENATPLANGYPEIPVLPTPPAEVKHPGSMPIRPKLPVEPHQVANPGSAPSVVSQPTPPQVVSEPTLPQKYQPSIEEKTLSDAYEGGRLPFRQPLQADYTLRLKTEITKYFRNAKVVTVRFFDQKDGAAPIYVIDGAELGTYVDFPLTLPSKTRIGYTCTFDYWQDENGLRVDLNKLQTTEGDLSLYPHFDETPNLYGVIWYVGGKAVDDLCAYDSSPVYDEDKLGVRLEKAPSGARLHRFTGWKDIRTGEVYDGELPIMTTEMKFFEAIFESSFVIEWSVDGVETLVPLWSGQMPVYEGTPSKPSNAYFCYEFVGWDKEIAPASQDVVYTAKFKGEYIVGFDERGGSVTFDGGFFVADCEAATEKTLTVYNLLAMAAEQNAGVRLTLSGSVLELSAASTFAASQCGVSKIAFGALWIAPQTYRYSLHLLDADGGRINTSEVAVALTSSGSFDADNSFLTSNGSDVRFSISSKSISFTMRAGQTYDLLPQFSIGVVPSEFVTLTASVSRAKYGDTVQLTLGQFADGTYLVSIYAVDGKGNDVPINDMSFAMPRSSVTVGVVCEFYEYTIVFKSDGKVLVTRRLKYGEQIVPPANPIKPSDGTYQYTFEGWDGELGLVSGDAEFNAIFSKTLLPEEVVVEPKLNKIIRAAYVAAPIGAALLVGLIIVVVALKRRKRKRNKNAK